MSITPRAKFIEAISDPEADIDMTLACLYIAAEQYPDLDVDAYVHQVDELAEKVQKRLRQSAGTYDAINAINRVLFDKGGFKGNRKQYYDPRNSYLSDVLDRRMGIPISLSVLYAEVGRRVGHTFDGIGLPGHFILATGKGDARIFVDPFDRGGLLTARESRDLAARVLGTPVDDDRFFKPVPKRSILERMLNNLKAIYLQADDQHRALATAERIQLLAPDNWDNLGDLAKLQTESGDLLAAMDTMVKYLELAPADKDTKAFEAALKAIEEQHPDHRTEIP